MQDNNGFESTAFATTWGSEAKPPPPKPQLPPAATNENRGFSPSWVPNWGTSTAATTTTGSSSASNSASKAPINPFTGGV